MSDKKNKKYIVMERSFEYNDEYYSESEGGDPVKIFDTKEEAQKHANKLNKKSGKTHDHLYEYDYDTVTEDGRSYYDLIQDEGKSIEEAVEELGPKEVFYVAEVSE